MKTFTLIKKSISSLLCISTLLGVLTPTAMFAESRGDRQIITNDFVATNDAYVRKENAAANYNYESISSAHGEQYNGKNYKVLNSKLHTAGNREIVGLIQLPLPTKAEAADKGYDSYNVVFDIFKNADPMNGPQSYDFYYKEDYEWSENSVTWNSVKDSIPSGKDKLLFTFTIEKDVAYENLPQTEKRISHDVSDKITELVNSGVSSVTLFVKAVHSKNTSLMIHTKESADGSFAPRLRAQSMGYSKETLKKLINDCDALKESEYTSESFAKFKTALIAAKVVANISAPSVSEIRSVYTALENTKGALVLKDGENIAYGKPTRSNLSKGSSFKVTDGSDSTYWSGAFYPSYVDVDLLDNYDIEKINVIFPVGKVCYFTLYGSIDGVNYDEIAKVHSNEGASNKGYDIIPQKTASYRIIRVYAEYTKGETSAYLSELKVYGSMSKKTNSEPLREGTFEEIIGLEAYSNSKYNKPITESETIENVYGIIERTVGAEYRDWFSFELDKNHVGNDYFELSDKNGKIHIKGNEGLSLTSGLNFYYKNYLNVHISEQTMQVSMPENAVKLGKTLRKETPYEIRYAYNYCTLSYSFAFFGEEEWQRENDYLALNGVNVVLDLAGQEATWIKFLMNFGYSFDDAKDWLTGPSYYAWQFMDNMEAFGGPVHDGYVKDRAELARSSQRWKNSLGMQTVLQGYAGMVPTNFNEFQPSVSVIKQGSWNGFSRPDMIATDSKTYDEYAKLFYEAQEYVYGSTTNYYAVDPFHEGGKRPAGLTDDKISKEVLESMLEYDENAVWIVQGWQSNPTNALLQGMGENREEHVLIVDLVKYPITPNTKYDKTAYGSTKLDSKEFNGTSWAWCLLANFGGNPSMHGQLEVMVNDIQNAKKTTRHMKGIGIISEATLDNPVVYDLIFDLVWADDDFDLDLWLDKYTERRYGASSDNLKLAWKILKDANYNHGVRYTNELFGTKNKTPQSYGKQTIPYGAEKLENALRLMLKEYDKFKGNECFRYDLTEIMRQQVSNYALLKYNQVLDDIAGKDIESFKIHKAEFLNAFDVLNEVVSTQKELLGGEWIGKAEDLAEDYDDFSKDAFVLNAKTLITTWGSKSGYNSLKDYGWRNYEGIFKDLYTSVWTEYLTRVENNLTKGTPLNNISLDGYFDVYWQWVMAEHSYTRTPKDSPEEMKAILDRVLGECAVIGKIDPTVGDLALGCTTVIKGETDGNQKVLTDGKTNNAFKLSKDAELVIDLFGSFDLEEVLVLLANQSLSFELYVSADQITWIKAELTKAQDEPENVSAWLKGMKVRYIKIVNCCDAGLEIKEIYAYGSRTLADLDMLSELIKSANGMQNASSNADRKKAFEEALTAAKDALDRQASPDELNSVYWTLYDCIKALDGESKTNLATGKPVSAHNDPSGASKNLTDSDNATKWDAGRLSATGKPYESTVTPGWAVVDLGKEYLLTDVVLHFTGSFWIHYELHISVDGENYKKVYEKKNNGIQDASGENISLENLPARYVKLVLTNVQEGSDGKRHAIGVSELSVIGKEIETSALSAKLEQAKKLDSENYTAESYAKLLDAITKAENALSKNELSYAEINEALTDIEEAMRGLEGKKEPPASSDNQTPSDDQPIDENKENENKDTENKRDDIGDSSNSLLLPLIIVGSVALLAGTALLAVIIKKRKNK